MRPPNVEEHFLQTSDGTRLAYQVVGEGPPILLCNGHGGSWMAWSHQINYFKDRYRVISWDYRGMYHSDTPSDLSTLGVETHARDGVEVLKAEGIAQAAVFGWSMGVQVALELFRQAPDRVASLMLINGVAGKPFASLLDLTFLDHIVPSLVRAIGSLPTITEAVVRQLTAMPETVQWAKRIGVAGKTLDEDIFHRLAVSFQDLDMGVYMRILEELGRHSAWDVLPDIDVPTLVIAGEKDMMTTKKTAGRMVDGVRGAEFLEVPGGTHYSAIEFPDLINLRIDKFLRERGDASAAR